MSDRQANEIEEAAQRAEWTRPGVERLIAGAAEGTADISSDGPSQPS